MSSAAALSETHRREVETGERFGFGRNWQSFLAVMSEQRIVESIAGLERMLGADRLTGLSLLDAGSGSGLSSLAALRLGARRVHSFDYDPDSVACSSELKRRYAAGAVNWTIEQGSVLDAEYLAGLGSFDLVYSWGVLHHSGAMWEALAALSTCVAPRGRLLLALYNDQGNTSRRWHAIKRLYCRSKWGQAVVSGMFFPYFALAGLWADLRAGRDPLQRYRSHTVRGMSVTHDWRDWLGGLPFEVARPEDVLDFCRERGFVLERLKTCGGGLGCNEYLFRRA